MVGSHYHPLIRGRRKGSAIPKAKGKEERQRMCTSKGLSSVREKTKEK